MTRNWKIFLCCFLCGCLAKLNTIRVRTSTGILKRIDMDNRTYTGHEIVHILTSQDLIGNRDKVQYENVEIENSTEYFFCHGDIITVRGNSTSGTLIHKSEIVRNRAKKRVSSLQDLNSRLLKLKMDNPLLSNISVEISPSGLDKVCFEQGRIRLLFGCSSSRRSNESLNDVIHCNINGYIDLFDKQTNSAVSETLILELIDIARLLNLQVLGITVGYGRDLECNWAQKHVVLLNWLKSVTKESNLIALRCSVSNNEHIVEAFQYRHDILDYLTKNDLIELPSSVGTLWKIDSQSDITHLPLKGPLSLEKSKILKQIETILLFRPIAIDHHRDKSISSSAMYSQCVPLWNLEEEIRNQYLRGKMKQILLKSSSNSSNLVSFLQDLSVLHWLSKILNETTFQKLCQNLALSQHQHHPFPRQLIFLLQSLFME